MAVALRLCRAELVLQLLILTTACFKTTLSFTVVPNRRTQTSVLRRLASTTSSTTTAPVTVNTNESSKTTQPQTSKGSFDDFDYSNHWYPVIWAEDLPLHKPTKVTVFDVDYVVARTSETEVMAMLDRCPHKAAALSEGRVTETGYFQCAYHGWSFDGKDGTCVEIPQVVVSDNKMESTTGSGSRRACGTAVPAQIVQGMVWLFPQGSLEQALLAPPPPEIPELDQKEFVMGTNIRDFPVDWSILLENIMDPDHGAFAHGMKGFDLYTATKESPQSVKEEFPEKGGWKITSSVDAVEKLTRFDQRRRGKPLKEGESTQIKTATTTFTAPNHVVIGRRDKKDGTTSFLTAFWICPVGTGRSRFMSAGIAKAPFSLPRWFQHVILNNFLDQDTFLLATQQKYVLQAEAAAVKEVGQGSPTSVRRKFFVYQSPAEKMQTRLGQFWDATLSRAPNRVSTLLALDQSNALSQTPRREIVLDREEQHLRICPDSQKVVQNCNRVQGLSKSLIVLAGAAKLCFHKSSYLKTPALATVVGISAVSSWLAGKLKREFYFKYTEAFRDRDLDNIPKIWQDKS